MTQHFAVGLGHFSGRINAGLVDDDDDGRMRFTSKEDCTDQALIAVAAYVLRQGGDVTITDELGNTVTVNVDAGQPTE